MKHRLLCNYHRDGAVHPPGTVLEGLSERELADLAGMVEEAGPDAPPAATPRQALADMLARDPERSDEELWTRSGKPLAAALSAACGRPVSAQERDEAWAAHQRDDPEEIGQ